MHRPEGTAPEQLTLAGLPKPRVAGPSRRAPGGPVAEHLPVARVAVDRSQPHLDRVYEYAVPAALSDAAQPGVRVKVRFGVQDLDGYVVERCAQAEHDGALTPLRRVVSPEVVLRPEILDLARAVSARYVGTLADVLRLAVPPRHARVEGEPGPSAAGGTGFDGTSPDGTSTRHDASTGGPPPLWGSYTGGEAFLRRVSAGQGPRAVWQAVPGPDDYHWADAVAQAVHAAVGGGRGALVVVPTASEVGELERALLASGIPAWTPGQDHGWVRLMADDGPAVRYRAFLAVSRGAATVAIGTRAAAFAPVHDLGLAVCWDEGDHLHAEPRAPYPHVREVLALRAELTGSALLAGGYVRSAATQRWIRTGWAHPLIAPRDVVRRRTPRVSALTSVELAQEGPAAAARLPSAAWRAVRDGLTRGPVLLQVPRAGYLPSVACGRCRAAARCSECHGPLQVPAQGSTPQCRWCGRLAGDWRCPECSATALRSVRVGSDRTAEELGRAFPGVPVRVSGAAAGVIASVGDAPAIIVATPGAEPRAATGYAAAILLDAALVTSRPDLDVSEQALRTWLAAAALVRSADRGGVVLLVGDAAPIPTQALVRWDPAGLAERDLAERTELALPPAVHMVSLEGPRDAVAALLTRLDLPAASSVLGPLAIEPRTHRSGGSARSGPARPGPARPGPARPGPARPGHPGEPTAEVSLLDPESQRPVRALIRTSWDASTELTARLAAAVATQSARRDAGTVRVQVEPSEIT